MCPAHSTTATALRKDLWRQFETKTPLHVFFPARFLFVTSEVFFPDPNLSALGAVQGDEELGRRYETDISYSLLGTRGNNSARRACQWVWIAHMVSGDGHWQGRLPGW